MLQGATGRRLTPVRNSLVQSAKTVQTGTSFNRQESGDTMSQSKMLTTRRRNKKNAKRLARTAKLEKKLAKQKLKASAAGAPKAGAT
jgi:hypothetical protein